MMIKHTQQTTHTQQQKHDKRQKHKKHKKTRSRFWDGRRDKRHNTQLISQIMDLPIDLLRK